MAAAAAAVTRDAICVCPPTARTTAVCEVPPPAGMAPNKAPARLAATSCKKFAVGLDGRLRWGCKGSAGGDRFGKAHQCDAKRAGQELLDEVETGQGNRRERPRDEAHSGDAQGIQTRRTTRARSRRSTTTSGSRRMGPQPLHRQQSDDCRDGDGQSEQGRVRQMVRHTQNIAKEAFLRECARRAALAPDRARSRGRCRP